MCSSWHAVVPILSAVTAVYLHGLGRYLPGEEVDLVLQDVESLDGIRAVVVCTGRGLLDGNIGDDSFATHHRIGVVLCWDLEHYQGVVKVVSCECFCCMMDARQDEDHSEDDDFPPFGLILRRQLRASTSMIPRYNGRDDFKLGSVKLSSDLVLKCYQPQVQKPARLLRGPPALRLASTLEVLEDCSCGCASVLSTDPSSGSGLSSGCL